MFDEDYEFDLEREYQICLEKGKLTLTDKQKEAIRSSDGEIDAFLDNNKEKRDVKRAALKGIVGYYRHQNQGGKPTSDPKKNDIIEHRYDRIREVDKLLKHRKDNANFKSRLKLSDDDTRTADSRNRFYSSLKGKLNVK